MGVRGFANIHPSIPYRYMHCCTHALLQQSEGGNEATRRRKTARPSQGGTASSPPDSRPPQQIRSEVGRAVLLSGALQALPIPATDEVGRELAGAHSRRCRQAHTRCPGLLGQGRMRLWLGNLPENFNLLSWTVSWAACPSGSGIAKIVLREARCSLPTLRRGGCWSLGGRRGRRVAAGTTACPQGRPQGLESATDSPWGQKTTGSPSVPARRGLQPVWCDMPRVTIHQYPGDVPGSRSMAGEQQEHLPCTPGGMDAPGTSLAVAPSCLQPSFV